MGSGGPDEPKGALVASSIAVSGVSERWDVEQGYEIRCIGFSHVHAGMLLRVMTLVLNTAHLQYGLLLLLVQQFYANTARTCCRLVTASRGLGGRSNITLRFPCLCMCESDHLSVWVCSVLGVECVVVAPCCAQDKHSGALCACLACHCVSKHRCVQMQAAGDHLISSS
jgi:hypothetical protein